MKNNIKNSSFLLLLAALFLANASVFGQNGSDIFLQIKGSKQGDITGNAGERGKEGAIKVATCQNPNLSPRDAASGQATGKRQHKPVTITKELDKSSPKLLTAFNTKENLPEVTLKYYGKGKACPNGLCYTIVLKEVFISSLASSTSSNGTAQEVISFTFQKIEWRYADGGVTHEDSWSSKKN